MMFDPAEKLKQLYPLLADDVIELLNRKYCVTGIDVTDEEEILYLHCHRQIDAMPSITEPVFVDTIRVTYDA